MLNIFWVYENPRVALLNIGEEEGKGNILAQATYPLLKENTEINFIGNIEGRDILLDKADVMVCDGFTGNVVLKLAESIYEITHRKANQSRILRPVQFRELWRYSCTGCIKTRNDRSWHFTRPCVFQYDCPGSQDDRYRVNGKNET